MSMGYVFFFIFWAGTASHSHSIFQNKFGGIPSHVQSIGFKVCHSVDGRADLLTGCNKSGADHFTMKHLSICWWLRQQTNKPVAESFSFTPTLDFLLYSSSSELKHYHSILCPLSISELFMWDGWRSARAAVASKLILYRKRIAKRFEGSKCSVKPS